MTLKQFVTDRKTGKIKKGAISRVAEFQGVSWRCVSKWISGEWMPSVKRARAIQDMIHSRIDLSSRYSRDGRTGRITIKNKSKKSRQLGFRLLKPKSQQLNYHV